MSRKLCSPMYALANKNRKWLPYLAIEYTKRPEPAKDSRTKALAGHDVDLLYQACINQGWCASIGIAKIHVPRLLRGQMQGLKSQRRMSMLGCTAR